MMCFYIIETVEAIVEIELGSNSTTQSHNIGNIAQQIHIVFSNNSATQHNCCTTVTSYMETNLKPPYDLVIAQYELHSFRDV